MKTETGRGTHVVRACPSLYFCVVFCFLFSFFFTSHSVQRGAEGSTICSDSFCFLYFIALLTLGGPSNVGVPFLGMLVCDHGNRPSQRCCISTERLRQKEVLGRETGMVYNVKTTTTQQQQPIHLPRLGTRTSNSIKAQHLTVDGHT